MADDLLLVGSIPLDTLEQVFRRVGGPLGPYLAYMPDGEVGDRRYWIDGIAYRVFNGHPEIETLRRPAPDANGVESWRPLGMHDQFQFRVKPGITQARFGDPGWRLGYKELRRNNGNVFLTDGYIHVAVLKTKGEEAADMGAHGRHFTGIHHFGFEVDDLDEAGRKLEAAHGHRLTAKDGGDAVLRDGVHTNFEQKWSGPDGVVIDVSHTGWEGTH